MAQGEVTRRLAAIVLADVAGYSRLMGQDEEGTLAVLRTEFRHVLLEPKTAPPKPPQV
jgi:adenylate cyclase